MTDPHHDRDRAAECGPYTRIEEPTMSNREKVAATITGAFVTHEGDGLRSFGEHAAEELANEGLLADDYHTVQELYDYRLAYNALLFNEWAAQGKHDVHKAWRHSDGELCFGGGWFIVCATTPHGLVSNHYHEQYWDMFDCEHRDLPVEYDGHTHTTTTHPTRRSGVAAR